MYTQLLTMAGNSGSYFCPLAPESFSWFMAWALGKACPLCWQMFAWLQTVLLCRVSESGLQCFGFSLITIRGKRSVRVLPNLEAGIIVQWLGSSSLWCSQLTCSCAPDAGAVLLPAALGFVKWPQSSTDLLRFPRMFSCCCYRGWVNQLKTSVAGASRELLLKILC